MPPDPGRRCNARAAASPPAGGLRARGRLRPQAGTSYVGLKFQEACGRFGPPATILGDPDRKAPGMFFQISATGGDGLSVKARLVNGRCVSAEPDRAILRDAVAPTAG